MGWLRSLFAQGEEITRLKAERDFHMAHTAELTTKLEASEAALRREIDSNRCREDSLLAIVVEQKTGGAERSIPGRVELDHDYRVEEIKVEADADEVAAKAELERQVEARAKDYAENARASQGIVYGPEQMEILKETFRRNPSEYLDN